MYQPKRLSKILISTIVVFLVSSVIAVLVSFVATSITDLVKDSDTDAIREVFSDTGAEEEDLNLLERTVSVLSTDQFVNLLSTDNLIALIVISILFGIAVNKSGEKEKKLQKYLTLFQK